MVSFGALCACPFVLYTRNRQRIEAFEPLTTKEFWEADYGVQVATVVTEDGRKAVVNAAVLVPVVATERPTYRAPPHPSDLY